MTSTAASQKHGSLSSQMVTVGRRIHFLGQAWVITRIHERGGRLYFCIDSELPGIPSETLRGFPHQQARDIIAADGADGPFELLDVDASGEAPAMVAGEIPARGPMSPRETAGGSLEAIACPVCGSLNRFSIDCRHPAAFVANPVDDWRFPRRAWRP